MQSFVLVRLHHCNVRTDRIDDRFRLKNWNCTAVIGSVDDNINHPSNMSLRKYFRWSDSKFSLETSVTPSDSSKDTQHRMSVEERVFQNPVIIQNILKHVLQKRIANGKTDGPFCPQTAKRLRLVSRGWLLEVNLLYRKAGQPMTFLTAPNFHKFLASTPKDENNWVPPLSLSLSLVTFSFKCVSFPRRITQMKMSSRLSLANVVLQRSDIMEEMRVLKLIVITKHDLLDTEDVAVLPMCLKLGSSSLEELALEIDWATFKRNRHVQVALNFPRMANLKKMKIRGKIWRLDRKSIHEDLGGKLPQLEELEFWTTGDDIFFGEWCRHSVFWNVSSLTIHMRTDIGNDNPAISRPFSKEDIQQICATFPSLVHFNIGCFDPQELGGLRYIFGHMGQLTSLQLNIVGEVTSEEEIDGLFIGAVSEMVQRLKGDKDLWGRFLDGDLDEEGIYTRSIRDMNNLRSLVLEGNIFTNNGNGRRQVKNVPSDLGFELGFMQLPVLDHLVLKGSFGVSEELADRWRKRKEGRKIEIVKGKPERGWIWRLAWAIFELFCLILAYYCYYLVLEWSGYHDWQYKKASDTWEEALIKTVLYFKLQINMYERIRRYVANLVRRLERNFN